MLTWHISGRVTRPIPKRPFTLWEHREHRCHILVSATPTETYEEGCDGWARSSQTFKFVEHLITNCFLSNENKQYAVDFDEFCCFCFYIYIEYISILTFSCFFWSEFCEIILNAHKIMLAFCLKTPDLVIVANTLLKRISLLVEGKENRHFLKFSTLWKRFLVHKYLWTNIGMQCFFFIYWHLICFSSFN